MFIVFEGITGSGKDTHVKLLADRLKAEGKGVIVISFPNFETEIARLTKRIDYDPYTLSLLYAADRSVYQERIKGLLERGIIVIASRYCYSNFAYQFAKGVDLEWLITIEKNIIKPNIVFLIDVPVEVSIKRIQQATIEDFTKQEILNRLQREREFLEKIRENYLLLSKNDKEAKWYVIDGTKNISDNHKEIWSVVARELKLFS